MNDGEWRRPMLGEEGANRPKSCVALANIVNLRPGNAPFGRGRLLVQGKDVDFVAQGQALDQRDERGNDSKLLRAVHTARDD